MSTPVSIPSIPRLKRRAKAISRVSGIKLIRAMDQAAQEFGCMNFGHAQNLAAASSRKEPERFETQFYARWNDLTTGESGSETLSIKLSKPWQAILKARDLRLTRQLRTFVGRDSQTLAALHKQRSQSIARELLCSAARELTFACTTGLRPSIGTSRAYPTIRNFGFQRLIPIPAQDHVSIWFDPQTQRYLIVDEPYALEEQKAAEERKEWCDEHDYVAATPSWRGIHAPWIGAQIHLFSHRDNGIPLDPLIQALNALPAPVHVTPWKGISVILGTS